MVVREIFQFLDASEIDICIKIVLLKSVKKYYMNKCKYVKYYFTESFYKNLTFLKNMYNKNVVFFNQSK